MAIQWQLHIVIIMNRKARLNLLVYAATESIQQWARDIKGMRKKILIVIHTFGAHMKWHPRIGRYTKKAVMVEYRIIYHDGKIVDKHFPIIGYAG